MGEVYFSKEGRKGSVRNNWVRFFSLSLFFLFCARRMNHDVIAMMMNKYIGVVMEVVMVIFVIEM